MKIDHLQTTIVDLPIARPHRLAMTTLHRHTLVILQLHTDTGVEGIGEVPVVPQYGEDVASAVKVVIDEVLAPAVMGHDPRRLAQLHLTMDRHIRGNLAAKAGIEMACADAAAQASGLSVSALFGGRVRDRLPMLWVLGQGEAQADIAEARQKLAERTHRLFLVKVGAGELKDDVARALAVKEALGDEARVRVDVNQRWDEPSADWALATLHAGGIELVEQPIAKTRTAGLARLTQRHVVPVMADEAVVTPEDAMTLATAGACDAFSLKLGKHGGMVPTQQIAHIAQAAGIGLFGGTMLEGIAGTSAAAQFMATLPDLHWGCQLFGPQLMTDDVTTAALRYEDFDLVVPEGPGLGATLDKGKLAFYRRAV